jgi:hypothetical protein
MIVTAYVLLVPTPTDNTCWLGFPTQVLLLLLLLWLLQSAQLCCTMRLAAVRLGGQAPKPL